MMRMTLSMNNEANRDVHVLTTDWANCFLFLCAFSADSQLDSFFPANTGLAFAH